MILVELNKWKCVIIMKKIILELTDEEMRWIRIALDRESDKQEEMKNDKRVEFFERLREKFK